MPHRISDRSYVRDVSGMRAHDAIHFVHCKILDGIGTCWAYPLHTAIHRQESTSKTMFPPFSIWVPSPLTLSVTTLPFSTCEKRYVYIHQVFIYLECQAQKAAFGAPARTCLAIPAIPNASSLPPKKRPPCWHLIHTRYSTFKRTAVPGINFSSSHERCGGTNNAYNLLH